MKIFFTTILCLPFVFTLSAQQADTTYYSVVNTGIIAGEQKLWHTTSNQHHYHFYYKDRGRWDSLHATVQTNTEGLIVSLKATGVKRNNIPYTESFEVAGDSATSTINGVRTTHAFNNNWYQTMVVPGITEMQLNWLLRQPDKKGNTFTGRSIYTEEPVEKNISFNGKTASLKLYAVYSDSVAFPRYVWFTKDTHFFAKLDLFSNSRGLFSMVQKGYETWIDTLLALQEQAGQKYYIQQMNEQSVNMPGRLVIEHANVFQSATATVKKDMTLEIVQGRITAIYPSSEKRKAEADSVINAKGKFLMPGLWDMHVHYEGEKSAGDWYVAGGVTHVRDLGGYAKILLSYKNQIAKNQLIGPDISYIGGLIDKQGLYQAPGGKIVSSRNEAIEAIHTYMRLGYHQIKIYNSIDPQWVQHMCAEAHNLGMRIGGHVPTFMTAEQAVKSGYDELTHLHFLLYNFLGDTFNTRTIKPFPAFGSLAGVASTLDLASNQVQSFIQLLKEKKIVIDATLNTYEGFFEFQGDTSSRIKPIINWLPDYMRTDLAIKKTHTPDNIKEVYRSAFKNMMKLMKLLYDNGIQLVAGTDGGQAITLHRELELYVQAGIPANEVLKIATYNAAKTCGLLDRYGEIKTGFTADLILIDGNPAQNIGDIRQVEWVIKNNKLYNPKKLLAVRGWKYYY